MRRVDARRTIRSMLSTNRRDSFGNMLPLPLHRVVITGIGMVSPLGVGVDRTWKRLMEGKSGVTHSSCGEEDSGLPRLAARVDDERWPAIQKSLESEIGSSVKNVRCILFALAAADEALRSSGIVNPENMGSDWLDRAGVCVGTGIGSIDVLADAANLVASKPKGHRRLSPFFVPKTLVNLAAGQISIRHGLRGPNHACANACATGANSIGDAFRFIQRGDADCMIAGGTEACIHPVSVAGFARMRALANEPNELATSASRPFDDSRNGFVIGEGAAVVVLERLDHAIERGAKIFAEIRGYGLSADAHHVSAPSSDGSGALRCMKAALSNSGVSPEDLVFINAHATSTPLGDDVEARAIARLLESRSEESRDEDVVVSSTKGATGHLLGASGAIEAAFTAMSVRYGEIPQTLNLENLSEELASSCEASGFVIAGGRSYEATRRRRIRAALSNSFGFGGTNASILLTSL